MAVAKKVPSWSDRFTALFSSFIPQLQGQTKQGFSDPFAGNMIRRAHDNASAGVPEQPLNYPFFIPVTSAHIHRRLCGSACNFRRMDFKLHQRDQKLCLRPSFRLKGIQLTGQIILPMFEAFKQDFHFRQFLPDHLIIVQPLIKIPMDGPFGILNGFFECCFRHPTQADPKPIR